jgi:2-polyprenyl-6-hydroxyphenyl methylase/3-demethylubiquinone-9 3-methyltransferase
MKKNGFTNIDIKGFDLFGNTLPQNILSYLRYKITGGFEGKISDDTSLMYIGKAIKAEQ